MAARGFGRHIFGVENLGDNDIDLIVPFSAPSPQISTTGVTENAVQTVFKTAVFLGSFILVAVLMAVLICLARWEFIVKCLNWRRGHSTNEDLEMPEQAEPKSEMMGLSKQQINSVPVLRYKESGPDLQVSQKFGTECSICLSEFDDGERIRVLPRCGHAFHVLCVDTWLRSHASCPSCRHNLLDKRSSSGKFRNLCP